MFVALFVCFREKQFNTGSEHSLFVPAAVGTSQDPCQAHQHEPNGSERVKVFQLFEAVSEHGSSERSKAPRESSDGSQSIQAFAHKQIPTHSEICIETHYQVDQKRHRIWAVRVFDGVCLLSVSIHHHLRTCAVSKSCISTALTDIQGKAFPRCLGTESCRECTTS